MEYITTPKVEHVKLLDRYASKKPAVGTLYLTTTHLIYVETTSDVRKETWILHHHIATVEKLPLTPVGCPLLIHCKNFRVAHFILPRERDCQDTFQSLLKLSQPAKHEELYAFLYNPKQDENSRRIGWGTVDLKMEFQRMGLPNDLWEFTDLNKNYGICSTYPADLAIPKSASKATIVGSSKFRSRGRFPVLSYFHRESSAAICRCSQPLSGFSARCLEDEQMLQAISTANPQSSFMYVVDTRPKLNAMANRAAGKGYENEDHYCNIRFQFVGIENIHVMRTSLQKLIEGCFFTWRTNFIFTIRLYNSVLLTVCVFCNLYYEYNFKWKEFGSKSNCHLLRVFSLVFYLCLLIWSTVCAMKSPAMSDYLTGLENSGWLRHIKAIMDAAVFLVKAVTEENASVLVHCSDGWDRTAQVCSLAGVLLDPYYRTIKGLMVLIEKEWISMGHKFTQRCGHLEGEPKEVSPVFTQFIECVWHLMEQYPCAFEFNERYLIEIHDHAYACQFGTFIGNCEKDRVEMKLQEKTYCVWPFLLEERQQFTNPLYKGPMYIDVLRPNTLPFTFKLWCGMYNRFDKGMHPKQSVLDYLMTLAKQKEEDEIKIECLQKRLDAVGLLPEQGHPNSVSEDQATQESAAPLSFTVDEAKYITSNTNGAAEDLAAGLAT